jgi:hypothetical protein
MKTFLVETGFGVWYAIATKGMMEEVRVATGNQMKIVAELNGWPVLSTGHLLMVN